MDLRLTFNEVAEQYDRMRPTYADELFQDIILHSALDNTKQALEIGIGTGQATSPFLKIGCNVTAIELGENMASYSKNKFADFPNFNVIVDDFESIALEQSSYDLVYSASAFQWIDPVIGFPKVYGLLKENGIFALFSHYLFSHPDYVSVSDAIDQVYDRYRDIFYTNDEIDMTKVHENYRKALTSMKPPAGHNEQKCLDYAEAIKQYGFRDVIYQSYPQTLMYDSNEYVSLISTYCDQLAFSEETRTLFGNEVKQAIESNGGKHVVCDTMDLYMAIK